MPVLRDFLVLANSYLGDNYFGILYNYMNFEHQTTPPNDVETEKTEGDKKIEEYTSRILSGQNPAYVLDGLPESCIQKVNETVNSNLEISLNDIPPQYKGMSSEALEIIWADQNNLPFKIGENEQDRSKEINRRRNIVGLLQEEEQIRDRYVIFPEEEINMEEPNNPTVLTIDERKRLSGWSASYELAKIAKEQGVDLSRLSREEYAEYAIQNNLAIDDSQLRVAPWQRNGISVEEIVKINKEKAMEISEDADKVFSRFCFDMQKKAEDEDRYLSDNIRVRQGTKDSNSWLFFGINEGTEEGSVETFKSYLSIKDLNSLTPERFKQFMTALRDFGYNGDVKIFQDLKGQGIKLNDQIVMHGGSQEDAELALEIGRNFFGEDIDQSSVGKDEIIDGVNTSYSQILSKKIAAAINNN